MSQSKPKATSFSTFSKDYMKNLSAVSSLESTEGIVSENSFAAALDGLLEKSYVDHAIPDQPNLLI